MTIGSNKIKELFEKHALGTASPEEVKQLFQLIKDENFDEQIKSSLLENFQSANIGNDYDTNRWNNVLDRIKTEAAFWESKNTLPKKRHLLQIVSIAAVLVLAFTGVYFFNNQSEKVAPVAPIVAHDVNPGDFGATLTLANGRKISLANVSKGEIGRESGIIITKSGDGRLVYEVDEKVADPNASNTLSTARGETYQVRLPDGSLVYLNAASSLTYSTALIENGKRVVNLNGEGYFEVAKDKQHPFIVRTNKQEVVVLGTHFNICSYADEDVEKTTLLEGSVKLSASGNSKVLKPGQQARLSGDKILVSETDTDLAVAWKNNEFVVQSEHIETIMKMISRWYNVEVVYIGEKITQRFSGKVSRFDKLSKVLEIVESTGAARFDVKGRTVYVSK